MAPLSRKVESKGRVTEDFGECTKNSPPREGSLLYATPWSTRGGKHLLDKCVAKGDRVNFSRERYKVLATDIPVFFFSEEFPDEQKYNQSFIF